MIKDVITDKKGILTIFKALKFGPMGLGEIFEEKYAGYKWYLLPHWRVLQVLYAVPADNQLDKQPWESWYIDDGIKTHHVHNAYKIHNDDIKWIQSDWTEERPDEIIGRYWYWYDDKNVKPVLLQQGCKDKGK